MSIRPLPKDLQKISEDELNEVPSRIQDDIQHIREWLAKQPHLNIRADEQLLISFLRGCKFSLQRVKEKLDCYYTMRTLIPEFFGNRDPFLPDIQNYLNQGVILPLPKTENSTGPRIFLFRWAFCDAEKTPFISMIKVYFMMADILMREDDNCMISGVHILHDYKDFSLSYMLQLTPSAFQKLMYCLQVAYPIRIKGIPCINIPTVFDTILGIVKPFMSEKLKSRLHSFTTDKIDEFYKLIPQRLMPNEYGGEAGSLKELTAHWKKKVESYRDWYVEEEQYGSNEKLRIGKPRTSSDVFGVEGTFRKLNID